MESPGVTVRPIQLISGASPFCETYFEDVRVPKANVLGKINDGWTVAKALLGHERQMIAGTFGGTTGGRRKKLADHARRYLPEVRRRLLPAAAIDLRFSGRIVAVPTLAPRGEEG